jgi:hypothetical protein
MNGMLLEYDQSTLAPLGLVLYPDELVGKVITIVDSGLEDCNLLFEDEDESGEVRVECDTHYQEREQAILVHDPDTDAITVVQPNEDGSFWRKIVRNKIARMKEKRREQAALAYATERLWLEPDVAKRNVKSTWGPYTTTSGNAL